MGKKQYKLLGIIVVLLIVTIITTTYAFAGDLRIAVEQSKPILRGATSGVIDLRGSTNISRSNPKITLSLKNTDVKPVLRMFADKAGVNLILHPSVKGYVNLDLVNVPLNDAFRMVLQITDLTYTQDGNTIIVSASDFARVSGISKQSITTVPVNYIDASLIANFLNQNIFSKKTPGLSNWDVVVTNPTRNELLVFGTQNDLAMVKKVVAKFDVPPLNTTFTVKHTTPAEMATLICRMLKMTEGQLDQGSTSVQWDYSTSTETPKTPESSKGSPTGLAANINNKRLHFGFANKGVVTGFASGSGGSSGKSSGGSSGGSSSGSSGSSSGGGSATIQLGKSIIACTMGAGGYISTSSSASSSASSSSSSGGSSSSSSSAGGKSGVGSAFSSVSGGVSGGSASMKLSSFGDQKMIISYFPQRGTINVLGGSQSIINRIAEYIKENDIKQPQAILDITIIELNEDGQKDMTNSWELNTRSFRFTTDTSGATNNDLKIGPNRPLAPDAREHNVDPTKPINWIDNSIFYKLVGAPQVRWYLNYVIKNSKGRVVADPKILLTNGETSTIELTSEYIDTVDAEIITSQTSTGLQGVERTYNKGSDLGLTFSLVPFISPEGYISLNFNASYATEKGQVQASITGGEKELVATLLNKRTVNLNNIRIRDNETLFIGGLVQETEAKQVGKVPFLGDIPVIGVIFRSTTNHRVKSELIMLLTPRVLKDEEDIGTEQGDVL